MTTIFPGPNISNPQIKFGTDGWRAVIDDDFIPSNVEKVIQAFSDWRGKSDAGKKILVGFDRRRKSPETARLVAEILAGNGFEVQLSSQFCPTPCISWMVKNTGAAAGIMVTASHNPAEWNGIKFKESYGGSASPEYTAEVEKRIPTVSAIRKNSGPIGRLNPKKEYLDHLRSLLDLQAIKKSGFRFLYDPLFGAGSGFMGEILGDQVDEIHGNADTSFGGLNPEPIDKNLGELMARMKKGGYQAGLATDGDADRIGAVDETGAFVNSQQIFALLLKHYVEDKKLKGTIVKSVSATQMIPILCKKYGLKCIETPIGFKHICKKLVEENALMGGEESGGLSFAPHVHERDGLLNGLFLAEMMAQRKKTLRQLIAELFDEIGPFYFDRADLHVEPEVVKKLQVLKTRPLKEISGKKVAAINSLDGSKHIFADGSWLLIRASGTEPLVRIYAEASSPDLVSTLLAAGKHIVLAC